MRVFSKDMNGDILQYVIFCDSKWCIWLKPTVSRSTALRKRFIIFYKARRERRRRERRQERIGIGRGRGKGRARRKERRRGKRKEGWRWRRKEGRERRRRREGREREKWRRKETGEEEDRKRKRIESKRKRKSFWFSCNSIEYISKSIHHFDHHSGQTMIKMFFPAFGLSPPLDSS